MKFLNLTTIILVVSFIPKCVNAVSLTTINPITQLIIDEFKNSGFQEPGVLFVDEKNKFQISIQGGPVDHTWFLDNGSFSLSVPFKYWNVVLKFSQIDGIPLFSSDSVTAGFSIQHDYDPHMGETSPADIFTVPATTLSNGDSPFKMNGKESHDGPPMHKDIYTSYFSVTGSANSNKIGGWTFVAKGTHPEVQNPEPITILGAGAGLGFIGLFGKIASKKKKQDSPEV